MANQYTFRLSDGRAAKVDLHLSYCEEPRYDLEIEGRVVATGRDLPDPSLNSSKTLFGAIEEEARLEFDTGPYYSMPPAESRRYRNHGLGRLFPKQSPGDDSVVDITGLSVLTQIGMPRIAWIVHLNGGLPHIVIASDTVQEPSHINPRVYLSDALNLEGLSVLYNAGQVFPKRQRFRIQPRYQMEEELLAV